MADIEQMRELLRQQAREAARMEQGKSAGEVRKTEEMIRQRPQQEDIPTGNEKLPERTSTPTIDVEATSRPYLEQRRKSTTQQAREYINAANDMARVFAGPLGDFVAAALQPPNPIQDVQGMVSGTPPQAVDFSANVQEQARLTEEARGRITKRGEEHTTPIPKLGEGLGLAGEASQLFAIPGAVFATPFRAMMAGGAISSSDTIIDRLRDGKPLDNQEGVNDLIGSTVMGAGGGFAGYQIGRLFGNIVGKFAGEDSTVLAQAQKMIDKNRRLENASAKIMDDAGVKVSPRIYAQFVNRLEKTLIKQYPGTFNPNLAKHASRTFRTLQNQAAEMSRTGTPLTLRAFNQQRSAIESYMRTKSGALGNVNANDLKIARAIKNQMNDFIRSLPSRKGSISVGDITGDVRRGVSGWEGMNKFHIRVERADRVADWMANAYHKSRLGRRPELFDSAFQQEFASAFRSEAGREMLEREFTKPQIEVFESLAYGGITEQALGRLDRVMGSTLFSPVIRAIRSGTSSAFLAEAAKRKGLEAISEITETAIPPSIGGMGRQLGGMAGAAGGAALPPPPSSIPELQRMRPPDDLGFPAGMQAPFPPQPGAGPGTNSPNVPPNPLNAVNPPRRP